jgi:hypothetical protein
MYPGEGAIEYIRTRINGLNREQAAVVIQKLNANPPNDPKIKRCTYCDYLFRDKTKNGSSKVCGESCRTPVKSKQKSNQRAKKEIPNRAESGNAKVKIKVPYVWWLEYPYYVTEAIMLSRVGRYERPFGNVEDISAARDRYERTGGRRKTKGEYDAAG